MKRRRLPIRDRWPRLSPNLKIGGTRTPRPAISGAWRASLPLFREAESKYHGSRGGTHKALRRASQDIGYAGLKISMASRVSGLASPRPTTALMKICDRRCWGRQVNI
ncbi:MAG: hypothetical protein CM15mP120_22620 [Pseudomonadota bacterium]|nr:MAG: hypothetical protein CM15mP120_22620 [Pseudomonadota bacterium]